MIDDISEVYEVESPEQLRVAADGTRQRILQPLIQERMTVTQVGELLGMAPAKAHYHVRELERVGLVRLVETRERGGILEKYYRAVARNFVVPPNLLRSSATADYVAAISDFLHSVTIEVLTVLQRRVSLDAASENQFTLARAQVWATNDEWAALLQQITALVEQYAQPRGTEGEVENSFVVLGYPAKEAEPDEVQ